MNDEQIPGVTALFFESARLYPDHPALERGKEVMTYAVLREYALRIATVVQEKDAGSAYVAVAGDRSLFSYAAILGILISGKGYVPLNPKYPTARNMEIITRSGAVTLLSPKPGLLPDDNSIVRIGPEDIHENISPAEAKDPGPDSPAYLLFTSGSTGKPKGVPVSHRNVSAYVAHMMRSYHFRSDDRFSQVFDLTFDLSVHDIFLCLASGACLVIPEEDNPLSFFHYIKKKQLTAWFSVPTAARMMNRMRLLKKEAFMTLRYSFFCGEPLGVKEATEWLKAASNSSLINLYGPTEATIAISEYEWSEANGYRSYNGIVSIGKLFPGQSYRISVEGDREDKGELWLSGSQVVDGYYHDRSNTEKNFTRLSGGTYWYKTGDIVKQDKEGYLYFAGRTDQEVKVHGYRVNLLEIDEVIRNFSGNPSAVVHERKNDTDKLVAFVESDKELDEQVLLDHCRMTLPWYMVPEKVIFVDNLPVNDNGKTDRKKLRELIR